MKLKLYLLYRVARKALAPIFRIEHEAVSRTSNEAAIVCANIWIGLQGLDINGWRNISRKAARPLNATNAGSQWLGVVTEQRTSP